MPRISPKEIKPSLPFSPEPTADLIYHQHRTCSDMNIHGKPKASVKCCAEPAGYRLAETQCWDTWARRGTGVSPAAQPRASTSSLWSHIQTFKLTAQAHPQQILQPSSPRTQPAYLSVSTLMLNSHDLGLYNGQLSCTEQQEAQK